MVEERVPADKELAVSDPLKALSVGIVGFIWSRLALNGAEWSRI